MGDDGVERGSGVGEAGCRQWFGEVKLELGLMCAAGRETEGWRIAPGFLVEGEASSAVRTQEPGLGEGHGQHFWSFPSTAFRPISCLPLPSPLSISDPEQQLRSGQSIETPWPYPLGTRRRGALEREWDFPRALSDLGQSWRSS